MRRVLACARRAAGAVTTHRPAPASGLRGLTTATTGTELQPRDEAGDVAALSPFLSALLNPPETIALEDAARTYSTMDVVEQCYVYDPSQPNVTATEEADPEDAAAAEETPIKLAHEAGTLWRTFVSCTPEELSAGRPPSWFESLCRDLFFRTNSADTEDMDAAAAMSDPLADAQAYRADVLPRQAQVPGSSTQHGHMDSDPVTTRAGPAMEVDPYLWLPFDLLDEKDYVVGPYAFPATSTYTLEQRIKLCLGNRRKEYVCFCTTYSFPERTQIPTSIGTRPAKLYVDPACPAPVVYLQFSEDFPPAMWLPVKATAASLRRVLSEFAQLAALHRDWHHSGFEARYDTAKRVMELQRLPCESEGDVLRYMAYDARNVQYIDAPLREFRNQQEFFLGEYDDPERLLEHLDLCPLLFSIPHLRTVVDPHAEHMVPTVEGPGVAPSLYRCIYSKAIIFINVQLSAEVKLPPQDPEAFHFMWKDSQVLPKMKIPVFARVLWPDNSRMCAGGLLNGRLNKLFGTEFAADVPPDASMALLYVMSWAKMLDSFMGVRAMRQRVAELEAAARLSEPSRLYPGTREVPNPEYSMQERLGMHIQYLSQLGDPQVAQTIVQLLPTASAPVRMGCAKAALIAGERELFRRIVSSEPPGRMQLYMTKLVRKRKTRDLVDPEPRLLDNQYEFAAPLWTGRGTRVDRNTLEGAVDAARLHR